MIAGPFSSGPPCLHYNKKKIYAVMRNDRRSFFLLVRRACTTKNKKYSVMRNDRMSFFLLVRRACIPKKQYSGGKVQCPEGGGWGVGLRRLKQGLSYVYI
jgi:hypothetical protein